MSLRAEYLDVVDDMAGIWHAISVSLMGRLTPVIRFYVVEIIRILSFLGKNPCQVNEEALLNSHDYEPCTSPSLPSSPWGEPAMI